MSSTLVKSVPQAKLAGGLMVQDPTWKLSCKPHHTPLYIWQNHMHHPPPWSMDVVKGYGWCHIWHNVWLSIHAKHFAQHLQKWLDVPSVECVRFVYLSHCWKVEFLEGGLAVREAISPRKCHKAMNTFRTSPLNWSKRAVKAIFHPKLAFVILEKNNLR